MKVYLAGPDVFLPDASEIGQRKKEICARFGLIGLFPLDQEMPATDSLSREIFQANTSLMERADAIIANLTPFRGPSADVGTIYELGFVAGRGKLCAGYSNVASSYRDKVRTAGYSGPDGKTDSNGMLIENFGLADNLMIVHALDYYGVPLVQPKESPADPLRDLAVFEACVRMVAERLARANRAVKHA
jgi:nucleoside 2-deoxyribosyltransferase